MDSTSIEERLQAIETRLDRLESYLKQAEVNRQTPWHDNTATERAASSKPKKSIELRQGNWLGFIAIICFVLAGGFIVKLSLEAGWLTPIRQISFAYLLGILLIASGLLIMKRDQAYASLLPAAGIIVLYLTTFGAHRLYFLLTFSTALLTLIVISGISIWLYIKLRRDFYSITASLGTYLAPVVLSLNTKSVFSLYYFLCASVAFAVMSWLLKSRLLTLVSAYFAILMTGLVGFNLLQDRLIVIMLALQFFIFALGTYFYSYKLKQSLTEREAFGFFPILILFYFMEYFYIDSAFPGFAPWISIGFALVLLSLYLLTKKQFTGQAVASQSVIFAFTAVVFFHAVYIELLTIDSRPWLFVLLLIALTFSPIKAPAKNRLSFLIPKLGAFIILVIEYLSILNHLFNEPTYYWILVSLSAFLSLWFLIIWRFQEAYFQEQYGFLLLAAVHFLGLTAFYQLLTNSLAVSAAWLFYAVAVIGYAYWFKDKVMAKSALLILSIAAGKALLYDAASTPTVIRILCLLLTGGVLYGCGYLLKKITNWK
ncbi:Predicted membrane protein [Legionella beliardensis]|uniref:Predicted membrane protein n=1 Tax=Legionella beliardensis TaxID=91822 RepID=A0A378HZ39_9GAMM|nr:DUF2339 domain-containing protein [Legionella beliardensis]STX28179.1 Predicted membrane protein [Legionella beliardensis]